MKLYTIRTVGEVPAFISNQVKGFEGLPATKDNFQLLDDEIEFIVCDCGLAHGNTDKGVKVGGGWLSPKDGSNNWHVWIEVNNTPVS